MEKLIIAFLLMTLTVPAWATEKKSPKTITAIEYVSPEQSVWTTRTYTNGEPVNPLLRVAEVLFAKADIPWHSHSYPAARMFKVPAGWHGTVFHAG